MYEVFVHGVVYLYAGVLGGVCQQGDGGVFVGYLPVARQAGTAAIEFVSGLFVKCL